MGTDIGLRSKRERSGGFLKITPGKLKSLIKSWLHRLRIEKAMIEYRVKR